MHSPVEPGHAWFALAMDWALTRPGRSHVWSPYSVGTALTLLALASEGGARDELRSLMVDDPDTAPPADVVFTRHLRVLDGAVAPGDGLDLLATNTLYVAEDVPVRPGFEARLRDRANAALLFTDFAADPEAARQRINDDVEKATRGLVRELMPPGGVTGRTLLTLVNTLWVRVSWSVPFDAGRTRPRPFRAPGGDRRTPMMHADEFLPHAEAAGWNMVSLPGEHGLVLDVLLPDGADGDPPALSPDAYRALHASARPRHVELALPRFGAESTAEVLDALAELTLHRVGVELDGLSERPVEARSILHRSVISVDERGAEAAAATAVAAPSGAPAAPPPSVEFTADRPFVFVLRRGGAILFLGRVTDPEDPGPAAS